MRLERYNLIVDPTQTTFDFISEGPKGEILKIVRYSKIRIKGFKNLYNLGFGDKDKEGSQDINDLIVTNNQDTEKVLATVAQTAFIFLARYPKSQIFMVGSTPARIRLYRRAIGKYLDELSETFNIQGYTLNGWLPFERNEEYFAFLISLK